MAFKKSQKNPLHSSANKQASMRISFKTIEESRSYDFSNYFVHNNNYYFIHE